MLFRSISILLLLSLTAFGQAFTPRRPFVLQSAPSIVITNPTAFAGLSNWWVFTDMPTNNIQVTNWYDRINNNVWSNYITVDGEKVTNTSLGVAFNKNPTVLREKLTGYVPLGTNSTTWIIHNRKSNGGGFVMDLISFASGAPQMEWLYNSTQWEIAYEAVQHATPYTDIALNQFYDHCLVISNGLTLIYVNGNLMYSTNAGPPSSTIWGALGGVVSTAFQPYYDGYIKEVAVWANTNLPSSSMVDLHWYATNTYGYSP